ncbi:MAG: DUF2207 domain-containing protein [Ferruginibacter sp.]|nr:DUF2207 domain-containing protein [Chitinophagaceae bacterium]
MRNSLIISLFVLTTFAVSAQKTKPPAYYFTPASEYYFTDAEIDSLLEKYSFIIFEENNIPGPVFKKHYPSIKRTVAALSQKKITQAFKELETNPGKKPAAPKGSADFVANKTQYGDLMLQQLRNTYRDNSSLSQYLYSSTNDRIVSFNTTVRIMPDGKLVVTEKIKIFNGSGGVNPIYGRDSLLPEKGLQNDEIKRGIVRSFPLYYINKYKLFQNTTFNVKQVLRNGQKEEYHTEKAVNGVRLFTGNKNRFINSGIHDYTIVYETDHQLKLLSKFDELYWNVTGNGWSFRMDSVSCTVILPNFAAPIANKCYTGRQGSTKQECLVNTAITSDSTLVLFKTTKALQPNEGLTIATSWPKGFIKDHGWWQQLKNYVWNNRAVFLLPLAALFSCIFCFIFWLLYGRDPKKGSVYPLFEPPAGYSPAELGYIYFQQYSGQLTAATIVDAAVRNNIKIDVERAGTIIKHNEYVVSKSDKKAKPPITNYNDFWSDVNDLTGSRIEKGKYNSNLADLTKSIKKHCEEKYKGKSKNKLKGFFLLNDGYLGLPGIICFLTAIWALIEVIGASIRKNYWQIAYFVAGIFLCSFVFKIFTRLLRVYTPAGRKMRDSIEGFRMFLAAADEQRFDTMNPPKKSLELYEKYLPFAIALDCAIEWGNKFEEIIDTAQVDNTAVSSISHSSRSYRDIIGSSFASSFSGTISAASTPPSSSSGGGSSFGGGSSGGGGGGGGGGGW